MCFTFVEFMTQELTSQWLAEIKALKQQIAELQAEHDAGWQSAEKWRKLYNTEAEQRRTDAQMAQQTIASLKAQIQQIQGLEAAQLDDPTATTAIQQEVEQLESVEELKAKLIAVTKERDRLLQALKTEQDNHSQTRKSLTTALGDAIDGLTKERGST
jgi:DNA-binding helix-hairpin-helix protein with protein kinase domain